MNILVIGGGGREHALVWKLKQSQGVKHVYCTPGNGGISKDAEILPVFKDGDWDACVRLAKDLKIDLTVVGPEVPLVGGIADAFRAQGLKIFGPSSEAARLEGSKVYSKHFMRKHGIPTADFEVFDDAAKAFEHIDKKPLPIVIKADGLAAGKGVYVCFSREEAKSAIETMLVKKEFGKAGERILIEDALQGSEVSLMAFCDGHAIKPLLPARDYKRVFDGNQGPNTGGMGAVAPSFIPKQEMSVIERDIISRFLKGVQLESLDFRGIIYFGIMLTPQGPKVLEFNVRFGDPETEAVLPLLKSDLAQIMDAVCTRQLSLHPVESSQDHCVTVVCCSKGYPGAYAKGDEIFGLESVQASQGSAVFHSGTAIREGKTVTAGGRVLNCSAVGKTYEAARSAAFDLVSKISFQGMHFRKDIGASNAAIPARDPAEKK